MINNNRAHNKVEYKYFFKAFYNRINRKKYDFQILQYKICHINIIVIKDIIIIAKKDVENKKLLTIKNLKKPQ